MRYQPTGCIEVALPMRDAIHLFTPEGEREWVPEWDPEYGLDGVSETSGTVFTTSAHQPATTWVIMEIDRESGTADYVRVTPGLHAGTVRVRCDELSTDSTEVYVAYDLTLLEGADPKHLDRFGDSEFRSMMQEWSSAIAGHLAG